MAAEQYETTAAKILNHWVMLLRPRLVKEKFGTEIRVNDKGLTLRFGTFIMEEKLSR
jgi:hypothetical protein